ncbi:hypothetical protein HK405_003422, partial [Cladochytrium tenue]
MPEPENPPAPVARANIDQNPDTLLVASWNDPPTPTRPLPHRLPSPSLRRSVSGITCDSPGPPRPTSFIGGDDNDDVDDTPARGGGADVAVGLLGEASQGVTMAASQSYAALVQREQAQVAASGESGVDVFRRLMQLEGDESDLELDDGLDRPGAQHKGPVG